MDWINANNISWTNGSLSVKNESASLLKHQAPYSGPWTEDDLTQSGQYVRNKLMELSSWIVMK